MRCGTIDISQLKSPPEKSEFETAKYFAERGKNNEIDFLNVCAIISLKIRLDPLLHSGGPRAFFFWLYFLASSRSRVSLIVIVPP